ncbi:DUF5131 family protein [Duganella sp. FT92W]|uniref:DUF5131 family protein n=1 Tax=Pseudoduganella rivuli TaxID=2666085 RepID=A0A7X2IM33_9BURK|nr:phage Gp37/Gp68 family protein [Pseudoduganella rivuli]MRV72522.1 DUF5131 family protein [Pseudoduganella rivuli]
MSDKTNISWTDATWNPVRGCSMVSAGCTHCYAMGVAARFSGPGLPYEGLTMKTTQGAKWNGKITLVPDMLGRPLAWRRPRKIFVNSMSDLFHDAVPDSFIDQVFAVMALAPRHVFQVLTKRPERMRQYCKNFSWARLIPSCTGADGVSTIPGFTLQALKHHFGQVPASTLHFGRRDVWPLPNVWLGVSVEDQAAADARVPVLLDTPAAVHWISAEPLLGPVDLRTIDIDGHREIYPLTGTACCEDDDGNSTPDLPRIKWVVSGGESGVGSRPMHPAWPRRLRDHCAAAGVAFLHKQNGEWQASADHAPDSHGESVDSVAIHVDGRIEYRPLEAFALNRTPGWAIVCRVGKRAAGRLLDGVLHDEYPEVA